MPYLAVVMPAIPEAHKDEFLTHWPTIAAQMIALPMVLGVSGGPVVGEDGAAVTEFKFLQTIAFKTLEDEKAFADSDFAKEGAKKYAERSGGVPPKHAIFECAEFPKDSTPKPFAQFSRMTGIDETKGAEARKAWEDLMAVLGKESWGGKTVGDGPQAGMGLVGWDSLEEAGAAYANPAAKAALDKYHSLGDCKDLMVKMEYFK
ncbi:hypothetical protein BKA64DRAFT_713197 [Cadophora sp. MPI-SDFR-AT-0126]|nr:hypothetical protein BKA64DRAFT_713197 [Leotiomycetes sp. MPI-SDFR-AT-0126]